MADRIPRISLSAYRTVTRPVVALVALVRRRRAEKKAFETSPLAEDRAVWTHEDLAPLFAEVRHRHNQRARRRRWLRRMRVVKAPQSGRHRKEEAA